uniref:Uncharacterized protein n=1 Tax=Anguilla anguilla TaxID=7936 RepID=A0A0E9P576_ANGAN
MTEETEGKTDQVQNIIPPGSGFHLQSRGQ